MTCQHTEGAYHDCQHVDARNARIRAAERLADSAAGPYPASDSAMKRTDREAVFQAWALHWNVTFHGAMRGDATSSTARAVAAGTGPLDALAGDA